MNRNSILPHEVEHRLIESIYGVTIDLDKYSDLLLLWEEEFLRSDELGASLNVAGHVNTAATILEMTQPKAEAAQTLEQVVAAKSLPTFTLSAGGKISHANRSGLVFLQAEIGEELPQNLFAPDDMDKINRYLAGFEAEKADEILTIIQPYDEEGEATLLFAISKIRDVGLTTDYLQISAVHVEWSDNVGAVIQKSFSLSDTELDLARRYVAGERLADIAASKNRSVNTLKVQTKSLYRKTKLNSQSELVRLFSALQSFALPEVDDLPPMDKSKYFNHQHKVIKRPDGRDLYYAVYGDPMGQPVLYIHDILMGSRMPSNVVSYLYAHKIKLIAPHRAGYGYSDANLKSDRLQNFVEDMCVVLEAEKINDFKILSQYVGSFYAYYLASELVGRVQKMRLINAFVPITSKQQLAEIPMPNKVLVYTSKYMPQLLPFFMNIMAVQVKKFGAEYAMKHYYKSTEFDLALCNDPEFAGVIADNFHCCFDGGVNGPSQTAKEAVHPDWSALVDECLVEVEYYHATDSLTPLKLTQNFVKNKKNTSLEIISGGQMILYKYPEKTLSRF